MSTKKEVVVKLSELEYENFLEFNKKRAWENCRNNYINFHNSPLLEERLALIDSLEEYEEAWGKEVNWKRENR